MPNARRYKKPQERFPLISEDPEAARRFHSVLAAMCGNTKPFTVEQLDEMTATASRIIDPQVRAINRRNGYVE